MTTTVALDNEYVDQLQQQNSPKLTDELKNNIRLGDILGSMESSEVAAAKKASAV